MTCVGVTEPVSYRIAYCAAPKIGGTYNFFRTLRKAIKPLGGQCIALTAGAREARLWDFDFVTENCVRIGPAQEGNLESAKALVDWGTSNRIDILIPMSSAVAASAVPHLPEAMHVVARCSSITRHAYDIVTCNPSRTERIVVTSQRQHDDLLSERHVLSEKLRFIPHGVDHERFLQALETRTPDPTKLRLGYIGRLEHGDKGCLYLADIVRELCRMRVPAHLDIIGDGPDRDELARRLSKCEGTCLVKFHGRKTNAEIAGYYARLDVFLLTSHFEGFPNSLAEAMSSGCVPIASRIRGVTDWMVEHGATGLLAERGDYKSMARFIRQLAERRDLLASLSARASEQSTSRFAIERMGHQYDELFREVISKGPASIGPQPWETFRIARSYAPTWRRFVPTPVKTWARRVGLIS